MVDAFPRVLAELLPVIRAAEGTVPRMSAKSVRLWRSEQSNLAIDGRECIVALVDGALARVQLGFGAGANECTSA